MNTFNRFITQLTQVMLLLAITYTTQVFGQSQAEIEAPSDEVLMLQSPQGNFGEGPLLRFSSDMGTTSVIGLIPNDNNLSHRTNSMEYRAPDGGRHNFFKKTSSSNYNDIGLSILNNGSILAGGGLVLNEFGNFEGDIQGLNNLFGVNDLRLFPNISSDAAISILNNGLVGVGDTNPLKRLVVADDVSEDGIIKVHNKNDQAFDKWWIGFTHGDIFGESNTNDRIRLGVEIQPTGAGNMVFQTGGFNNQQEQMRIDEQGDVGIGIERPSENLHVKEGIRVETATTAPKPKTLYANSGPLAYGTFAFNGAITGDYGIASATRTATGVYEVVLDNTWSGVPAVNTMIRFDGLLTTQEMVSSFEVFQATKTIKIYFADTATGAGRDAAFSLVVFGTAVSSTGSGCGYINSTTGLADAPDDILKWNATEDACCVTNIDFAPGVPTPHFEVSVMDFTNPPSTAFVNVTVTINSASGGGTVTASYSIPTGTATAMVGTFTSAIGVDYDTYVDFDYDGVSLVEATVRLQAQ